MTKFDGIFRDLAVKLIDNTFGTSAVISREASSYDPITGDNTRASTDYSVKISPPQPISQRRLLDGSVFQRDDLTCIVAAKPLTIEPNPTSDKLVYKSDTFQIVAVRPFVSGDQDAAYELTVRR